MNDEITREQGDTTLEQGGFDAISEKRSIPVRRGGSMER